MEDGIYRNTCPRNCYGTCGILSHVKAGKLVKVTGDPAHGFTRGRLCAKGYAYTQFVYNPHRLKYPMLQTPRGSGNWKRISWDEALTIIADKMIELNERYGSNLASGYNKYSGNLGLLHFATEGMFNSIGPHTKPIGNPCALTGKNALERSFGGNFSSIPEEMAGSKLIVLWGANPAVTNVHQMKFIYEARRSGAKLVVIDPVFTQTAKKADLYIQINPGTDMWLALGVAKLVYENGQASSSFLNGYSEGWEDYVSFLKWNLSMEQVCERTGVSIEAITELASLYSSIKPVSTWAGLGIQRNHRGNDSIEAINSLAALTGNLTLPHAGLYFMHFDVDDFPNKLYNHAGPAHSRIAESRYVDISDYASSALSFSEPPLKLLWIASRNIFTQDQNLPAWKKLIDQLELIVTVDMYLTKTAAQSDLVLPAATHFEEEDLNVGYWHYWLSLNQKAIPSYFEAKSDLQIARELTRRLNEKSPGFSNFPSEKEPIDWIRAEITPAVMDRYGINRFEQLFEKAFQKQEMPGLVEDGQLSFRFFSPEASGDAQPLDTALPERDGYTLFTPQSLLKIHSQYEWVAWLDDKENESIIEIPLRAARKNNIADHDKIELYNDFGKIAGIAKISAHLPDSIILTHQAGSNPINQLIKKKDSENSDSSTYFYDSVVGLRKWRENHV
ncbi:dehydrogenase [Bacillus sp. FJAT-18017]|uniref:molybdopterin-dependent oxidoreductase n=1 Tax=Bacillus sp. FJAT-18017 TaxID=1705566 RepID=UPI0006AF364A|nr:molybdopterin-dependent oxidoreductase [Bacillus sp. FJAT-18017]ALC91313.1 dehydrogenase [Bacillus sp. FJAT-18017]